MYEQIVVLALSLAVPAFLYVFTRPPKRKPLPAVLTEPVGNDPHHRHNVLCRTDDVVPILTAHDAFSRGLLMNPQGDFLGFRQMGLPGAPYKWISYQEVNQRSRNLGSAFVEAGWTRKSMIGLYAKNSPDWNVMLQCCNAFCFTLVPLYDTLGLTAMTHILKTCELKAVLVDVFLLPNLLKWIKDSYVRLVVVLGGDVTPESLEDANRLGVEVVTLAEFEERGAARPVVPDPPTPEDIAVICYTSGTTGHPKGAIITHDNIAHSIMGIHQNLYTFKLDKTDTLFSYLPLAHVYEFAIECYFSYIGGRIGYFQGNLLKLLDDFETLQPTLIPAVPRVLNKAFDRINNLAHSNAILGRLFDFGLQCKIQEVEAGIYRKNSIWDKILFRKIQKKFGGNLRLLITGSAPCRKDILTWYRAVLGCFVMEGFGQTEVSGVGSMSLEGDCTTGHIGVPLPSLEVKLVDVPEKGYMARENRGEICFRGRPVFKGYYKDPKKTAETIDSEGWLHTGDIGTWTEHGCISIIDRKKNIFKLAQGEYIAPDKIEAVYERTPLVSQCFVYGESLKSSLVGLVVPEAAELEKVKTGMSVEEFVGDKDNAGLVLQMIQTQGQKELKSFEQVRHVTLLSEAFSVENELLTPTSKKRREAITKQYKDVLKGMLKNMS